MQYQAGYALDAVRNALSADAREHARQLELDGLYDSLNTFDVYTILDLSVTSSVPAVLAVASNILTRGFPTLPSVWLEEQFSQRLGLTTRQDNPRTGKINFPFVAHLSQEEASALFQALHPIEPRAKDRTQWLEVNNTDSEFERDFLTKYIPADKAFLTQLLEKQRGRHTLLQEYNRGRVDFSLEIPYNKRRKTINKFRKEVSLDHHTVYIVEIDGARYHSQDIDAAKDFALAQLPVNVQRVREATACADKDVWLSHIQNQPYLQRISTNYHHPGWLTDPWTTVVLAPFCIARIQQVVLRYLMAQYKTLAGKQILKLAVIERDIPGAHLALRDLQEQLYALNELAKTQHQLPTLKWEVFSTEAFLHHRLQAGFTVAPLQAFDHSRFDLVIDISLLRRGGIFKEDAVSLLPNTIQIRNSHYTDNKTATGVLSAAAIEYRPLVTELPNEIYEPHPQTVSLLRKFLQDIFRKESFREGQLPILNRALQLQSIIGLLPTGGGKSLTYQLAALLQPGTTIVIDPIRSLMVDQFEGLREIGIHQCAYINSTLSTTERSYNQQLVSEGRLQIVFVSPERFVIDEFRRVIEQAAQASHFFTYAVIDEVHCVSEWGHDFRTPYLNLGENAQQFCGTFSGKPIPLFGLTATASFDVLADIERELHIAGDDGHAVVRFENSVRNEINYQIEKVPVVAAGFRPRTIWDVRNKVGQTKQEAVFRLLAKKQQIVDRFNEPAQLAKNLDFTFMNFLASARQQQYIDEQGDISKAISAYRQDCLSRLTLTQQSFMKDKSAPHSTYRYGVIVFTPHKTGALGIHGNEQNTAIFNHPSYVVPSAENNLINLFEEDSLSYFMGSSEDDDDTDRTDKESFTHLKLFKENKTSVMVATKAFGMGIDKPDIRLTIHLNIPSSIESFVQEAGRAGRDGQVSTAVILFNNDRFALPGMEAPTYHLDKDVLMYFHHNSFKGTIKERVMLHEMRSRITFPQITNLQRLTELMNETFGDEDLQFLIKIGTGANAERVFINTRSDLSIGYLFLTNQKTGTYNDYGDRAFCEQLVTWLKAQFPFECVLGLDARKNWFYEVIIDTRQEIGLERLLADMRLGDKKELIIPFTNLYHSKKTKRHEFEINVYHLQKVLATAIVKRLIQSRQLAEVSVIDCLTNAVLEGYDYLPFAASLPIGDPSIKATLANLDDPVSQELQRAYCAPRSKQDTAKAIYRLISIGIIDTYTMDFQNKRYHVQFTKKDSEAYFQALHVLMARYTSAGAADRELDQLKKASARHIASGKATVLSSCLEFLTDFIYDKIKKKRAQAIDDMVSLCQTTISYSDPHKQNQYVREEIYYYFNAKYTRRGYKELGGSASMPDDLSNALAVEATVWKYIQLAENEATGELISNIKHMRGSAMRMLRSDPDAPQFRILKSFALFVLANGIPSLLDEAKQELVTGLMSWSTTHDTRISGFIADLKDRLGRHINKYSIDAAFDNVEDRYYLNLHTTWLQKFGQQLTS